MCKVIATDLDGTLFYPKAIKNMICKKSLKFLRTHIDNGGKIVLVTGRNTDYLHRVAQKIERAVDMVGCNGSILIGGGEVLENHQFNVPQVKLALEEIGEKFQPKGFFIMTKDNKFIVRDEFTSKLYKFCYAIWNKAQGIYREPFYVNKEDFNEAVDSGNVAKIMIFFGIGRKARNAAKEANKIFRETYGDTFEASWSGEFIELSPKGCSKSNALKSYCNYFNINHSDIYVVGDSGNDISMFNEFPETSFCMKHAPLSVSKYAKHTIRRFHKLEKFID